MELREIIESLIKIEEEKNKNILGVLTFTGAKGNFKNKNNRIYSTATLKKAVGEFNEKIKKQNITGILSNLDHARSAFPTLSKGSHLVTKLWMDGDEMKGQAAILNTTAGKDLMTILKSGASAGISMKGTGTIAKNREIENFELLSLDVVGNPSFGDVTKITQANLFESSNEALEKEKKSTISLDEFNNVVEKALKHDFELLVGEQNWAEKSVQESFETFAEERFYGMSKKIEKILEDTGTVIKPTEEESQAMRQVIEKKEQLLKDYSEYVSATPNSVKPMSFDEFKNKKQENE